MKERQEGLDGKSNSRVDLKSLSDTISASSKMLGRNLISFFIVTRIIAGCHWQLAASASSDRRTTCPLTGGQAASGTLCPRGGGPHPRVILENSPGRALPAARIASPGPDAGILFTRGRARNRFFFKDFREGKEFQGFRRNPR